MSHHHHANRPYEPGLEMSRSEAKTYDASIWMNGIFAVLVLLGVVVWSKSGESVSATANTSDPAATTDSAATPSAPR